MATHQFTGLTLSGDFSDDGEYFLVTLTANGVDLRCLTMYVGDQRSAFDAIRATPAPAPAAPAEPAA